MTVQDEQLKQLFKPLNKSRIKSRQGAGSYLEAWDVIAHLSRIFGPLNWDKHVLREWPIFDEAVEWTTRSGEIKSGYDVCWGATVRLTVHLGDDWAGTTKVSEDSATGTATHQPVRGDAHDQALKSAVSDALKRAAKDLGNQFGLSLYDNGGLDVISYSLAHPNLKEEAKDELPKDV